MEPIIWNKKPVFNLRIGPPIFVSFPNGKSCLHFWFQMIVNINEKQSRTNHLQFIHQGRPHTDTQRSSFYFLCVRISNDDLTRCDSSHIDTVSHLSSLRPPFPFTRLLIVSLGNERKPLKTVSRRYVCCDIISLRAGETEGFVCEEWGLMKGSGTFRGQGGTLMMREHKSCSV